MGNRLCNLYGETERILRKKRAYICLSGEAETGNTGGQPAKNNLANREELQGMQQTVPCSSQSSLLQMPSKLNAQNKKSLNLLKSVQFIGDKT